MARQSSKQGEHFLASHGVKYNCLEHDPPPCSFFSLFFQIISISCNLVTPTPGLTGLLCCPEKSSDCLPASGVRAAAMHRETSQRYSGKFGWFGMVLWFLPLIVWKKQQEIFTHSDLASPDSQGWDSRARCTFYLLWDLVQPNTNKLLYF